MTDAEIQQAKAQVEKEFGSRNGMLFKILSDLAISKQKCDVCLRSRKPHIDVTINENFILGIVYGAGPQRLLDMLNDLKIMSGSQVVDAVSINDIVAVNPMPNKGFTAKELAEADLVMGDMKTGPNGMTVREMIHDAYKCENDQELDYYLRRFIAS